MTQTLDPSSLELAASEATAALPILLVGEPPAWQPRPAPLGPPDPLALEIVVADVRDADALLASRRFEVAVVNLTREARTRLEAVRRWRRRHPETAWLALTGPEPMVSEEVTLRAGILEEIPDADLTHGLPRAVRRALARRAAQPEAPVERASEPPAWESSALRATRLTALGVMAAGVAHEINNPLAYVRSNLEFVLEEFEDLAERFERLVRRFPNVAGGATGFPDLEPRLRELRTAMDEANEGVTRVADVVGGLKQFSSRPRAEVQDVDLVAVARASLRIASRTVEDRARLVVRLGPVPPVRGHDTYLGQVVLNLLVNAAQALPEGSAADHVVAIRTYTDADGCAVVEVSDTGPGMSDAVVARIFEPFFTTKDDGEGTGLGLAVSRKVVEAFGGKLACETAEGRGSIFRVILPPA